MRSVSLRRRALAPAWHALTGSWGWGPPLGILLVLAVAALLLAGCTNDRAAATTLTVAEACAAYTSASRTVRPHVEAGLLTLEQLDQIEAANTLADSVCVGPPPANVVEAVARLNEAVSRLLLIADEHGGA